MAILFRQTNVVWVIFVAANGAIKYAEDFYETKSFPGENEQLIQEENNLLTNKKRTSTFPSLRRRKMNNSANTNKLRSSESSGYSHFHSPGRN